MTSDYFLTDKKFSPKMIASQNFKFNSCSVNDVSINNILNYENAVIKTDQFKIFDETFSKKNIMTMNNVNYENLNKIHRQSLVGRDLNKIKLDYMDNLKLDDSGKLYDKSLGTQLDVNNNSQLTSETINESVVEFYEDNNHLQQLVRTHLSDSLEFIDPVNFIVNTESKTINSTEAIISFEESINDSIVLSNTLNSFMIFEWLIIPFKTISVFNHWIRNFLRKACRKICTLFNPKLQIYAETEAISLPRTQITENNRMLFLLTEKVDSMKEEISEIRSISETTFSSLLNEVQSLRNVNKKISDDNDALIKGLKNLSQILEVIQSNSKAFVKESQSSGGIPPPPPPPPPLPPSLSSSQNTPTDSKIHTPKKSSMPQIEKRPVITMDDLLKVTLRKAPQIEKEKPKTSTSDPRPVISLEMLKNVKLKSIKQRSQNYKVRSPHGLRNRSRFQNIDLSPIMAGSVSPLSRILSRGESFRRRPRKILTSPRVKEENDEETQ